MSDLISVCIERCAQIAASLTHFPFKSKTRTLTLSACCLAFNIDIFSRRIKTSKPLCTIEVSRHISLPTSILLSKMTPDYLQGTYTTYKKDTDAIANWLATTAKRCGFSPEVLKDSNKVSDQSPSQPQPEVESTRLKGRARKLAREAAAENGLKSTATRTYIIPIKSFTRLASQIVSCSTPTIKVPTTLGTILNRAISFRKEYSTWFRNTKLATETGADGDSHAHFISVLEHVRDILQPHMADKATAGHAKASHKPSNQHNHNAFEVLEVEELSDDFLNAPSLENSSRSKR